MIFSIKKDLRFTCNHENQKQRLNINKFVIMMIPLIIALLLCHAVSATQGEKSKKPRLLDTADVMGKIVPFTSNQELGALSQVTPGLSNGFIGPILAERKKEFEARKMIKSIIQELRTKEFPQLDNKKNWLSCFGDASDELLMIQFIIGFDAILANILSRAMRLRLLPEFLQCDIDAAEIDNSIWMQAKIMKLKGLLNAYKAQYVDPKEAHPMRLECDNEEFMSLWRKSNELIGSMEHVIGKNDYALLYVAIYCGNLKRMMEAIALKIGVPGINNLEVNTTPKDFLRMTKTLFVDFKERISANLRLDTEKRMEAVRIFKANVTAIDDVIAFLVKVEQYVGKL